MGHYIRDINGNYIWVDDSGKQKQVTNEGTIASNAGTKKQAVARQAASQKQKERKKAEERESFNTRNEVGKMVVTGVHQDPVTKEIITDENFDRTRVGGGGLSGYDPLLGTAVEWIVGGKMLGDVWKGVQYGLGRYGTPAIKNWARGRLIGQEFNRAPIHVSSPRLYATVSPKGSRPLIQYGADFLEPSEYFEIRMQKFPKQLIQDNHVEVTPFSDLHTVADYGEFTPKVKASIGKFNELYGRETINRFRDLGYDVETPIPIIEKGFRNLRKPITAIEQNTKKPVYLGTYNKETSLMGQYWPEQDVAIVDPTLSDNLPSIMFHERNMHGTDNIIDAFDAIGQPKAKNMYQDFLDKLFIRKVNHGDVDVIEPAPGVERVGKNSYMIDFGNGYKYPMAEGTDHWYEGRSTINELKRKYLYDVWSNAGKPENLGVVRRSYLKKINELSEGELLGDLANKTNGYGQAYVALRKNNPNFIPDLKHLLKYGPMFAGAGYVSKQKQGGKFKYYIPKKSDSLI